MIKLLSNALTRFFHTRFAIFLAVTIAGCLVVAVCAALGIVRDGIGGVIYWSMFGLIVAAGSWYVFHE